MALAVLVRLMRLIEIEQGGGVGREQEDWILGIGVAVAVAVAVAVKVVVKVVVKVAAKVVAVNLST